MTKPLYWFHLCKGSTENMIDSVTAHSWQEARAVFKANGYTGKFIMHQVNPTTGAFRCYQINIKAEQ